MPPSRGMLPGGRAIARLHAARPSVATRSSIRQLSSASLLRDGARGRVRGLPAATSITAASVVAGGRANLSLWPFWSSGQNPKPQEAETSTTTSATTSNTPSTSTTQPLNADVSKASVPADTPPTPTASPLPDNVAIAPPADHSDATLTTLSDAVASNAAYYDNITYIGQLKELGLQWGWGPTSTVEWVVEHIHVYSGMPWWGTIVASAIVMRLAMLYPTMRMSSMQARMAKIQPEMQKFMTESNEARKQGNVMGTQIAAKQISALKKRNGVSVGWMLAPAMLQAVFGFGAFKLTRAMAALPVPGFETGGFAWITNLTVCDPLYITPLALVVTTHLLARLNPPEAAPSGSTDVTKAMRPVMLYVLPAGMFAISFWQPVALQLSFLTATTFGAIQNTALRRPGVRRLLNLEPMPERGSMRPALNMSSNTSSNTSSGRQDRRIQRSSRAEYATPEKRPEEVAQNAFENNPFANLNVARSRTSAGSSFESGVRYQAPTAAETLAALAPSEPSPESSRPSEDGKGRGFLANEMQNVKTGFGSIKSYLSEKTKEQTQSARSGDKGRDLSYVRRAMRYEEDKRKAKTK